MNKIYFIDERIRERFVLDVTNIDGENINSLDEYMFRFKSNGILVYAYLKLSKTKVNISYLHEIFNNNNIPTYFESPKYEELYLSNEIFKSVIDKYVRNKYVWCHVVNQLQSYFFDSKYLLLGNYQKIAKSCAEVFFHGHNFHYTNLINKVKNNQERLDYYNEFFIKKRELESEFYDTFLNKYKSNKNLVFLFHYNKIEIYDKVSELYLQITLDFGGYYEAQILFSDNKLVNKSHNESKRLALNIIVKNRDISNLYNTLMLGESVKAVDDYLNKLEELKTTQQYKELFVTYDRLLTDIKNRESACYFNDEYFINAYFVHNKYFEQVRINKIFRGDDIRLKRRVNIKVNDEYIDIELKSFMIKADHEETVNYLMMSNMLNIGHIKHEHDTYEYRLMSENRHTNYSLAFMKEPTLDSSRVFSDYIEVQKSLELDIEYHLDNEIEIKDTRMTAPPDLEYNTVFERYGYYRNKEKFLENKDIMFKDKNRLMVSFLNKLNKVV